MNTTDPAAIRKSITENLWDNNIRIDKIIWLAANSSSICDDLERFLEEEPENCERLFGLECPEGRGAQEEYLTDLYNKGVSGYLIRAATPVREKGKSFFTWGYTTSHWFYFIRWDESEIATAFCAWTEAEREN